MSDDGRSFVQGLARALTRQREEVKEHSDELRESLAELHRRKVPRVTLELTEEELRYLDEVLGETRADDPRPEGHRVYEKVKQLLMIETGMGGKFHR